MQESILHYIWQYKLFPQNLKTIDGKTVEVIDTGKFNSDAGPDFFNAKIKIDGTLWAGNVEFHQNSTDWKKHRHTSDKAYDNVILHIAEKIDEKIFRTNGEEIPQMELKAPETILRNYEELFRKKKWIYCGDKLHLLDKITVKFWLNVLALERLEQKTSTIFKLLENSGNHWEEAFYVLLARSFGFGVNSQPFELLAKSLPLNIPGKHKDNLLQIESLLFGQAGFLEENAEDDYFQTLKKEYAFLKTKYGLSPMEVSQWKLLRLRPENFPTIRIAQFASLIHASSKLFSKIIETEKLENIRNFFSCEVSGYWKEHYLFGKKSKTSKKKMGSKSIDILLINTVIPFLFAYSEKKNNEALKERALHFLEQISPEINSVIEKWKNAGISSDSAFETQALLQLKTKYCDENYCLRCRFGHRILTTNVK